MELRKSIILQTFWDLIWFHFQDMSVESEKEEEEEEDERNSPS